MAEHLTQGHSGDLAEHDLAVIVDTDAPVDVSALLVGADGVVGADDDFVFYNQPSGTGVALLPGSAGQPAWLAVSLAAVGAAVERIRIVVALDGPNAALGRYAPPVATVADAAGHDLYTYRIDGLTEESAVVALDLYRDGTAWRVRAVGEGRPDGFAALLTEHGVRLNGRARAPRPASVLTETPAGAPAFAPPTRTIQVPDDGWRPRQPAQDGPVIRPLDLPLQPEYPIALERGHQITLRKRTGSALSFVKMGLGWDPIRRNGYGGNRLVDIDLDSSVCLFSGHQLVDVAYYGQLTAKDGSVRHLGDNLTGEGDGDDEIILVDLTRVPERVTTLVFLVTSYKGHTFEQINNAFCRLVDGADNAELARFALRGGMPYTALVMAVVFRDGPDWKLRALGEGFHATHPGEAIPQLGRFLIA
ncbi:TerD family protein [Nocardia thailandica]|uniref:TerD family protein n=1 Tax=Nocardia thailandica TaxID=257275 RepID=UPI00069470DB|nr:TerD family protein [Nocardia thailandica]